MNKEPKTLPEAIKILVGIYGTKFLNDARIVNIMSDVVSLEEPNSIKTILKECIRNGYGNKVLSITPKDDLHLKIKSFSKEISDSYGYKDVIVQYVLYSMAFGIGICTQRPYLKNHDTSQPQKDRIVGPTKTAQPQSFKETNKPPYRIMAVGFVVLVICTIAGFSLWNASEERALFQNRLFTGDSFLNNGDYDNAIESYKEAYNGYNAMNSASYKEDALGKIDGMIDKLLKEGKTDNKSLLQAYHVLQSEMQLNLDKKDKERLQAKQEEVETIITEKTDNGRNNIIMNLSVNNGILDENGKKQLLDLLVLSPDDYWLNFIKKKSYE